LFSISVILCLVTNSFGGIMDIIEAAIQIGDHLILSEPTPRTFAVAYSLHQVLFMYGRAYKDMHCVARTKMLHEYMLHISRGHALDHSQACFALGTRLQYTFSWATSRKDNDLLEEAVVQYRKAMALCPHNHIYLRQYVMGIISALVTRFWQNGRCSALDEAISLSEEYHNEAVRYPLLAVNISEALSLRAKAGRLHRTSQQALFQRAANLLQSALEMTPDTNAYHPALLRQLNEVYLLQSNLGFAVDDDEHFAIAQSSVQIGAKHYDVTYEELNLARLLLGAAQKRRDVHKLQQSMVLIEHIRHRPPPNLWTMDPGADSDILCLHASCYMVRFELLGVEKDLQTAEEMFEYSCQDLSKDILRRLEISLTWADAARCAKRPESEMRACRQIIDLIPQLVNLGEDVRTRFEALQPTRGLACRAATLAITTNDILGAIELLEQSRSVLWSQLLQLQTSIASPPPQYAAEFTELTESLKNDLEPARRRRQAAKLEDTINQIRQVEGYERFLQAQLYSKLKECASRGVVVVIIPSDNFTDVVAIRDLLSAPWHLRLHVLKLPRLQEMADGLKKWGDRSRGLVIEDERGIKKVEVGGFNASRADVGYLDVFREMWTELVFPVIVGLNIEVSFACFLRMDGLTDTETSSALSTLAPGIASGGAQLELSRSCRCTRPASITAFIRTASRTTWSARTRRRFPP
jgi:tetratricopeptide (TPR) repeat protein